MGGQQSTERNQHRWCTQIWARKSNHHIWLCAEFRKYYYYGKSVGTLCLNSFNMYRVCPYGPNRFVLYKCKLFKSAVCQQSAMLLLWRSDRFPSSVSSIFNQPATQTDHRLHERILCLGPPPQCLSLLQLRQHGCIAKTVTQFIKLTSDFCLSNELLLKSQRELKPKSN